MNSTLPVSEENLEVPEIYACGVDREKKFVAIENWAYNWN